MSSEFKSFYKTVGGNEGNKCHYLTRLDTYGCGCQHDCKYCYAKSLLDFRGLWYPDHPSVANIEKIRKKIESIAGTDQIIRLGGMTDCFQPIEKIERVTYETIKELNKNNVGYLIVTKSAIIAEDQYMEILDKRLAHIQITVTTLDDDLSRTYERASVPSERIKAILKLQEAGYDVAIRLSPFIPEYMDVDKLSELGINKAIVEFLRVNGWIRKWFNQIDYSEYTVKHKGYRHLPLEKKRELIEKIKINEVSVCEDEDDAYEYWRDNFNPNPDDCCNLRVKGV